MDHRVRWLLAAALMWATTAQAQAEPDTGPATASSAPLKLWTRVTALIAPPPGAQALATGTAFFVPSPDAQPRLMTVGHLVDGCLRIDLLSEGLPTTRAELMSVTMAPEAAMLRVPQMPPSQSLPVTLTFRPLADPPTTPGTKLTVLGFPSGADLLKPTVIEMTDITDSVPTPPKCAAMCSYKAKGRPASAGRPAPLWRDPRAIHRLITLDHLLRMRSGLGFPVRYEDGRTTLGFENSSVYQDATDAFEAAQRSIVATIPGSVFRYINAGPNVLGAIIRDQIPRRGLPHHRTVYGLLADRLGMASYQHSADIAGNLIASGAGFASLRDYAKIGVLYLQDGVWNGERLLPPGWADYALTPTHTGTSYAACFRANTDRLFPDLPPETAWASGASDQRIFILRRHRLTVAVANETDYPMDLACLNRVIATAIAAST